MSLIPGFGADLLLWNAAGGFSPADLNPVAWWDFTDAAHVLEGASDPVETNDDLVSQVDDLSGNAHHLVQSTSTLRPLWKTAGYVEFPGSDEYMEVASPSFTMNPFEIYMVFEQFGSDGGYLGFATFMPSGEGEDWSSVNALSINSGSGGEYSEIVCNSTAASVSGSGNMPLAVLRVNATGSTLGGAYNNGTLATASVTPASSHAGPFRVGARFGPGYYGLLRMREIVLFDSVLGSTDRTDLLDYLYDRHGITP